MKLWEDPSLFFTATICMVLLNNLAWHKELQGKMVFLFISSPENFSAEQCQCCLEQCSSSTPDITAFPYLFLKDDAPRGLRDDFCWKYPKRVRCCFCRTESSLNCSEKTYQCHSYQVFKDHLSPENKIQLYSKPYKLFFLRVQKVT